MTPDSATARFGEEIPAAPFVAWLRNEIARAKIADGFGTSPDAADGALANRLEVSERAVYRYKNSLDGQGEPTDTFRRNMVEDMLDRAGVSIYDVYPELEAADDTPLEDDAFCKSCQDVVTPIDGKCPWCDRSTTDEVPRRMYCKREDAMRFPAHDGNCWQCGGKLHQHIPRVQCGCGCGREIGKFNGRTGLAVTHARGHGRGGWAAKGDLPVEPFAEWLEGQLRDQDPIQSLARRVGLPRDLVLAVLGRRVTRVERKRVVRALHSAAVEGQSRECGWRPGSAKIGDLYPDRGGVLKCPRCGGRKVAKAELCRACRIESGWVHTQPNRPTSLTPEVLAEARRLREQGLMWKQVAFRLQPRTRCGVESLRTALIAEFKRLGWSRERGSSQLGRAA